MALPFNIFSGQGDGMWRFLGASRWTIRLYAHILPDVLL